MNKYPCKGCLIISSCVCYCEKINSDLEKIEMLRAETYETGICFFCGSKMIRTDKNLNCSICEYEY